MEYHASGAYAVAAGNLNPDGKPDFVVASPSAVSVFIGNGDGTFQAARVYLHTGFPAALADFNLDGEIDLATPIATSAISVILHTSGNGAAPMPSLLKEPLIF